MLLRSISIFLTCIFDSLHFLSIFYGFCLFPIWQSGVEPLCPDRIPPMTSPGLEVVTPSGFAFAGLVEVDPRNTKRGLLLQDRVGRAKAPALPIRQHLILDGLRPGTLEGQDFRHGMPHVLLQSDAAVDGQAAATDRLLSRYAYPADVVLAAVVALRPQAIVFGVLEEICASLRMVPGRKGVGHGQRVFEVNVLSNHDDFSETTADMVVPDEVTELVHELIQAPAGQLMPVVLDAKHEPV